MCETCLNEPAWGPEMSDFNIFPGLFPLFDFFLLALALALPEVNS